MKNAYVKVATVSLAMLTAVAVAAQAFEMPSSSQVRAAANNPAQLSQLTQGASPDQAARVLAAVLAELVALEMEASARTDLAKRAVTIVMGQFSGDQQAVFAQAFGAAVGANATLRGQSAMVSAVQGAMAGVSGPAASLFAAGYMQSADISVAASGQTDGGSSTFAPPVVAGDSETPPPPPAAPGYRNQPI